MFQIRASRLVLLAAVSALVACEGDASSSVAPSTALPSAPASATSADGYTGPTYEDDEGRFSFSYPEEWTTHEAPKDLATAAVFVAAPLAPGDDFPENVKVALNALPNGVDFATYNRAVRTVLEDTGTTFTSTEETTVAGHPGYLEEYERRDRQLGVLQGVRWAFALDDGTVFILLYSAEPGVPFDKYLPGAEDIVASFEVP